MSLDEGVPFDRKSFTFAWALVVAGFLAASVLILLVPGTVVGIRIPLTVRLVLGSTGVLFCGWISWLLARRFSRNQPAIYTDLGRLVLSIYPTRTIVLDRAEVERVGSVRQARNGIERFMFGPRIFELHTTRRGLSALRLLIGSKAVVPPLDDVRELVVAWARSDG